ncbi:MAG TPA: hypothetical protein VLN58_03005 [Verrucomicrobiae bacterium]|nr:hypothetical protein [Verrucomicrobiae bacterium]
MAITYMTLAGLVSRAGGIAEIARNRTLSPVIGKLQQKFAPRTRRGTEEIAKAYR